MIQSRISRIYLIVLIFFFYKRHSHTDILRLIFNFNNKDLILLVILSPIVYYNTTDASNAFLLFNDLPFLQTSLQ